METKLFSTFGIEFGYLPPRLNKEPQQLNHLYDCQENLAGGFADIFRTEFETSGVRVLNIGDDEGCLEITSKPFKTLKECKKVFDFCQKMAKKYNVTTHRDDQYSGGGHIHWGLGHLSPKERVKFLVTLYRDIHNRPYLNWMFNEFCDIFSAEPYFTTDDNCVDSCQSVLSLILDDNFAKNVIEKTPTNDGLNGIEGQKGCCTRYDRDYKTVELRIFDAKRAWWEVEAHVKFGSAYMNYIQAQAKKKRLVKMTVKNREDILAKVPTAVKEFKAFVEELGLDWKVYKKFIPLNWKPRLIQDEFVYCKETDPLPYDAIGNNPHYRA